MEEPEAEPSAPPETLAPQCEHSGTADDSNRDTDAPQSPNPTNDVAVSEAELGDKGTACLAGEMGTIAEKFALDEEEEEVGTVAGDDNPSVKEEKAEAEEGSALEMGSSVKIGQLTETEALHEAVIAGTEEVLQEDDSQIDHEVRIKECDDDQMEASIKEEAGPTVEEGSFSKAGATGEPVVAGSDDIMPKEDEEVEQEVELMDETETKEEDFTQTDEEAPHTEQEMVHLEANCEGTDGLQSEDNNPTQDEETNMDDKSMHDDHGGDKAMDEDLTQDEGGDKGMDEDSQDGGGDKTTDEDSVQDRGGDKAMDGDSTQEGGGDKAMDETAMGVDSDGMDDDGGDDQAAKHGDEGMGMNDGEDEEDDDPPTLPAKKSSGGKKKRGRPARVKKGEEELCFICFDGGELVVCDRRSDY